MSLWSWVGLVLLGVWAWQWFLSSVGLVPWAARPPRPRLGEWPIRDWPLLAVLIPAHNEERAIGRTVRSILQQDYPGRWGLFVVADRCTDRTVHRACRAGAGVLVRREGPPGKGAALEWAIDQLGPAWQAVAVVDVGSELEPGALEAMGRALADGAEAVQLQVRASNAGASWVAAEYAVMRRLWGSFLRGRALLGLPILLMGTGWAVRRAALERVPFRELRTVTEDMEYAVRLARAGVQVRLLPEAVQDEQPVRLADAARQLVRWQRGALQTLFAEGPGLLLRPGRWELLLQLLQPLLLVIGWAAAAASAARVGPVVAIIGPAAMLSLQAAWVLAATGAGWEEWSRLVAWPAYQLLWAGCGAVAAISWRSRSWRPTPHGVLAAIMAIIVGLGSLGLVGPERSVSAAWADGDVFYGGTASVLSGGTYSGSPVSCMFDDLYKGTGCYYSATTSQATVQYKLPNPVQFQFLVTYVIGTNTNSPYTVSWYGLDANGNATFLGTVSGKTSNVLDASGWKYYAILRIDLGQLVSYYGVKITYSRTDGNWVNVAEALAFAQDPGPDPLGAGSVVPPPGGLSVSAITTSSAHASWNPSSGASSYRVTLDGQQIGSTSSTSWDITGLQPGTWHMLQVVAVDSSGHTSSPVSASFWTLPAAPNVTAAATSPHSATASWSTVAGATAYQLSLDGVTWTGVGTSTSYSWANLAGGTTYTVHVRAVDAAGAGPEGTATFTTPQAPPPPDAPAWLQVTNIGQSTADASWAAVGNAGILGYRLWLNGIFLADTASTSYHLTGLKPGTQYTLAVAAEGQNGVFGAQATATFTTASMPLPGPITLTLGSVDYQHVELDWTEQEPTGDSCDVFRDGSLYAHVGQNTSYVDTSVRSGQQHSYFVRCSNAAGSTDSNTVQVTVPPPAPVPGPPNGLSCLPAGTGFAASWHGAGSNGWTPDHYTVLADGQDLGVTLDPNVSSYTYDSAGWNTGEKHVVTVAAWDSSGQSYTADCTVTVWAAGAEPADPLAPVKAINWTVPGLLPILGLVLALALVIAVITTGERAVREGMRGR
ncbi:MAG: glycosyltransferase [Bacillota bacterium]|nr:glycosyltransferase [Bacillota bacterium]